MKYTCSKCGETFDKELKCQKHEEEHWLKDTPALGDKNIQEFVISMTDLPDEFDGKATQLFGNWIKWLLLCIITFGIYSFWLSISLKKWKVKHTHFVS